MRCADCRLYKCAMRSPYGECVFEGAMLAEQPKIITTPNTNPGTAMKLLEEKIKLVSEKGTFDGIDVDEYLAEIRGHDTKLYQAASDLVDAVERYMRQECLRSELAMKKKTLKKLIER